MEQIKILVNNKKVLGSFSDSEAFNYILKNLREFNLDYMSMDGIKELIKSVCDLFIDLYAEEDKIPDIVKKVKNIKIFSDHVKSRDKMIEFYYNIMLTMEDLGPLRGFFTGNIFNAEKVFLK